MSDQIDRGTITLPRQGRVRAIALNPEQTKKRLQQDFGFDHKEDKPDSNEAIFWTPAGEVWTRESIGGNRDRATGPNMRTLDIDTSTNTILFEPEHDRDDLL